MQHSPSSHSLVPHHGTTSGHRWGKHFGWAFWGQFGAKLWGSLMLPVGKHFGVTSSPQFRDSLCLQFSGTYWVQVWATNLGHRLEPLCVQFDCHFFGASLVPQVGNISVAHHGTVGGKRFLSTFLALLWHQQFGSRLVPISGQVL